MKKWDFVKKTKKRMSLNNFVRGIDTTKDDIVMEETSTAKCYNVDTSTGVIRSAHGIAITDLKSQYYFRAMTAAHYNKRNGQVVIITKGGYLMWFALLDDGSWARIPGQEITFKFSECPQIINYRINGEDVLLFCSRTDGLVMWKGEGTPVKLTDAPKITSMAVHNERLFVTVFDDKNTLWYSDDLDPTNWNVSLTGAGFIQFADDRGELKKVISFGGYLYVFRKNGISRVSAFADQTEFSVTHLFTSSGIIFEDTVTLCGDRIMFCSSEGIFVFDGVNTVRLLDNVTNVFKPGEDSCAGYWDGKYYVASKIDFKDGESVGCESGEYVHNTVFIYDIFTKNYTLYRGLDVVRLCPMRGRNQMFMIENSGLLYVLDDSSPIVQEGMPSKWQMPKSDLGIPHEKKLLKFVTFFSDNDVTVQVDTETESKRFFQKGSKKLSVIPVNVTGYTFSLTFLSTASKMRVAKPTLVYY